VIATLVFMMILARRGGDSSDAVQRGQQALALAAERSLRWLTGFVLVQLGAAQIWIDPPQARARLVDALHSFGDCEDQYHLTVAHFWLAALYQSENSPAYLEPRAGARPLAILRHADPGGVWVSRGCLPQLAAIPFESGSAATRSGCA
jgi:hypothetical protein